jgi:hypothetical protein
VPGLFRLPRLASIPASIIPFTKENMLESSITRITVVSISDLHPANAARRNYSDTDCQKFNCHNSEDQRCKRHQIVFQPATHPCLPCQSEFRIGTSRLT